jgi:hypothetical protein
MIAPTTPTGSLTMRPNFPPAVGWAGSGGDLGQDARLTGPDLAECFAPLLQARPDRAQVPRPFGVAQGGSGASVESFPRGCDGP